MIVEEQDRLPAAHSLIEAGGEVSGVLMAAIARHIEELAPGQVLEVASLVPTARIDAVAWCHVTGHELLALLSDGDGVRFWIRKRPQ
jgi:TusA-related sulfurtransferase